MSRFKDTEGKYITEPSGYRLTEIGRTFLSEYTQKQTIAHKGWEALHCKPPADFIWEYLYMLDGGGKVISTRSGCYDKVTAVSGEASTQTATQDPSMEAAISSGRK